MSTLSCESSGQSRAMRSSAKQSAGGARLAIWIASIALPSSGAFIVAMLLSLYIQPSMRIHDEFSYRYSADTLLHGRLSNLHRLHGKRCSLSHNSSAYLCNRSIPIGSAIIYAFGWLVRRNTTGRQLDCRRRACRVDGLDGGQRSAASLGSAGADGSSHCTRSCNLLGRRSHEWNHGRNRMRLLTVGVLRTSPNSFLSTSSDQRTGHRNARCHTSLRRLCLYSYLRWATLV